MAAKRMLWSTESMEAAVDSVLQEKGGLREAARLHNILVEILRKHVNGSVEVGARPGPATVLTEVEEDTHVMYLIEMADKGYGLTRETVMELVFKIVDKTGRKNPFQGGKAGRAWFERFKRCHPQLSFRIPQPLSYCRAVSANQSAVNDFFGKLGSLFGRLNLISKPMLIYNCDETGISIVHKPGKVMAEMECRNMYALGVFKSFKTHFSKACSRYMSEHPGRVVTANK